MEIALFTPYSQSPVRSSLLSGKDPSTIATTTDHSVRITEYGVLLFTTSHNPPNDEPSCGDAGGN